MKPQTFLKLSQKRMEKLGFTFTWGYSYREVCVRYKGEWIGTYTTKRGYTLPRQELLEYAADYTNLIDSRDTIYNKIIKITLEKWERGKNTTIDNFEIWWFRVGRGTCSFCEYYNDLCGDCPLRDDPEKSCCSEWHKMRNVIKLFDEGRISKHEAYKRFHEEAVKLYNRISKITPQSLTQWSEDNGK